MDIKVRTFGQYLILEFKEFSKENNSFTWKHLKLDQEDIKYLLGEFLKWYPLKEGKTNATS